MPEQLVDFIDRSILTADKRNLAVENPITLMIDVDDIGTQFYVVVSYMEPNHVTLPLNVTWIVVDPDSPHYRKALRRASALPFNEFRNTWVELRAYQDFLDEPQFWDLSATFQLGEVQVSGVQEATVESRGLFQLATDPADPNNPIVVGSNDIRMEDARQPLPHVHPLLPSTMLQGSTGINEFYVTISDGSSPQQGEILVLTDAGDEPNEWMGYWRAPLASDIIYDGPTFTHMTINGVVDDRIDETVPVPFTADAHFSDGSTILSVPATWDIISNTSAGTISSSTGSFTSNDIVGEQVVRVRATWLHPESQQQQLATYDLTIVDTTVTAALVSIELVPSAPVEQDGSVHLNEGSNTVTYTIVATYDDASTAGVIPATFTSSNPASGVLDIVTGTFTSAVNVDNDQLTTLTATYVENGVTQSHSVNLLVVDTTVYPQSAVIQGPTSIDENSTNDYILFVTFTDLTASQVAVSDWAIDNPLAGVIDATSGQLSTPTNLDANEAAIISASFTSNGRTVSATLNITAVDTTVYPASATILGPVQIDENTTQLYQLEVTFTDSTTQIVNVSDWASSVPGTATINVGTGQVTAAADVPSNQITQLSASYTQGGITVSDTHDITVLDTTNYPVSAVILGNASMPEGGLTQTLIMRVTYQDSSTVDVVPTWASSNVGVATVNASGTVTQASNLIGNGTTTITATFSELGVDFSETFVITVTDETVYPVSARILGPTTVSENTTVNYAIEVTYDDSTVVIEPVSTFASTNAAAGTITTNGQFTAPGVMTVNELTTITASFTLDGTTVSDSLAVTVTDDTVYPASATIIGSANINEESTGTYQLEVTFTDASTSVVTVTDWATSNTGVATINANTGLLTSLTVTADEIINVTASYTNQGVTVNGSLAITVKDTTVYPSSASIVGPAIVNENGLVNYTLSVTYSDSTSATVPVTDWANTNALAGVINANTGAFQATANVSADVLTTISASHTANGVTVSDTLNVTVADITAYPVSASVIGPVTVVEELQATYILRVTFDDTSVSDVAVTDWAIDNPLAGVIDATTGLFTAAINDTGSNISGIITATHTVDGVTVTGTLNIGVSDTSVYPVSAVISGPATINEGGNATFTMNVTYSDTSTALVTPINWAIDNAAMGTMNASTGQLTAGTDIVGDKIGNITASYTENGVTVGDSASCTIVDTVVRPVSLVINGPTSINEGINQAYTLTVTYDTGSTATVSAIDWAIDNALAGAINATTGILSAADVSANQLATLSASFTAEGVTVNATLPITVNYLRIPLSAGIVGSTTVAEGSLTAYQFQVTFDDSSVESVIISDWASTNVSAGSIDPTGDFQAVANVTSPQTTDISGSYTENGVTVSNIVTVTVENTINLPVSATVLGVNSIEENNSATYQFRVTYEDGTTAIVAIADWNSSDVTAGAINATTGVFVAAEVTTNTVTNIGGSYTENGVTVNGSLPVTVNNVALVSAVILGPTSVAENSTANYTFQVTYSNATTNNVSITDWAYTDPTGGSINATTGVLTSVEVAGDRIGQLSGSFTEKGVTVSAVLDITVTNGVVVNAGMPRWGYGVYAGPDQTAGPYTGPQDLIDTVCTSIMPSTLDNEEFTEIKADGTTLTYFASPASLGDVNFYDVDTGFSGGWDGGTWLDDFSTLSNTGPAVVTYDDGSGPATWNLYRTDFEGPSSAKVWRISYALN